MVDLSKYVPSWSDDRYTYGGGKTAAERKSDKMDFVELIHQQAIWHVQRGGDLSDLIFDKKVGVIGRFDKDGNEVIIRRFGT